MIRTTLPLVLLLVGGCHAKFKKHAPHLGEVRTEIYPPQVPYVDLGSTAGDDLVGAAINAWQGMNEWEMASRIREAVDTEAVGWALEDGVSNTLKGGPPFAWTGDEDADNVLQLDVVKYGIEVPSIGARGDFTYVVKARIYTGDAERVYKARTRCEAPLGDPNAAAVVFGGVNNIRQFKNLSDAELQAAFEDVARWCGQKLVQRMRDHAR